MNTKGVLYFSIGPIGAAFLGLATLPATTWLFSIEDVGRFSMLQALVSLVLLLFSFGLDQAYVREFNEVVDKSKLLKAVFAPCFFVSVIFLPFLVFGPWGGIDLLFGLDSFFLSILILAALFFSFVLRFLGLVLRMNERGLSYSMIEIIPKSTFLFVILSYFLLKNQLLFVDLVLGYVISLGAALSFFVWSLRREIFEAFTAVIDMSELLRMLRYSVPLIGGGIAFWCLTTMDKFFLQSLSGFEELGMYSIAVRFAGIALIFQTIFSIVWAPTVFKWAANDIARSKVESVTDSMTLVVVMLWTLVGMFSWVITYLLPPDYFSVDKIVVSSIAYPLLYVLSESTGIGINITRRTTFVLLSSVMAVMVNASVNWLLIPVYGAAGAAVATVIAFLVFFVIRTETSSMLWFSFSRLKMYCFVFSLSFISIIESTVGLFGYGTLLYFLVMILGILSYYKEVFLFIGFVFPKLKNVF